SDRYVSYPSQRGESSWPVHHEADFMTRQRTSIISVQFEKKLFPVCLNSNPNNIARAQLLPFTFIREIFVSREFTQHLQNPATSGLCFEQYPRAAIGLDL